MRKVFTSIFILSLLASIAFASPTYSARRGDGDRGSNRTTPRADFIVDDDGVQCPDPDYSTIVDAVNAASGGETIAVCPGEYDGMLLTKEVHLVGHRRPQITGGPAHPSGLIMGFRYLVGSDNGSITGFTFTDDVDLTIMNGDGVNGVTVEGNTFLNQIQGVSNWRGDNWIIKDNTFVDLRTSCGGGIAILVGAFDGVNDAMGTTVEDNNISGTLHVSTGDCGGYNGTGIVLYSDHRFGRLGGLVHENSVKNNNVSLVSDTPEVVDVVGIELTDTRDDLTMRDVVDNFIGKNMLRRMDMEIVLTPENLDEFNTIRGRE